jgi:hypothetical protein
MTGKVIQLNDLIVGGATRKFCILAPGGGVSFVRLIGPPGKKRGLLITKVKAM